MAKFALPAFSARQIEVIEAAYPVLMRLGLNRITMQDVAQAAGLSRPALYLQFANKEELVKAVLRWVTAQNAAQILQSAAAIPDLKAKLAHTFTEWIIVAFRTLRTHPEVADLFRIPSPEMQYNFTEFEKLLAELVPGITVPVARTVVLALHSFKEDAADEKALRKLILAEVELVLAFAERAK